MSAVSVLTPKSASAVTLIPYQVRKSCRFFTDVPLLPFFSVGFGIVPLYLPVGFFSVGVVGVVGFGVVGVVGAT